jgi:hypothetical protein
MADFVRALVQTYKAGELAENYITNTVHFRKSSGGIDIGDPQFQTLAVDIATLFATYREMPQGYNRVQCKTYNMEDAKPRPIKGDYTKTDHYVNPVETNPREVALCLSYFSERNLPRQRGRVFTGPWAYAGERPSAAQINALQALKQGLADIGGTNIQWCVYSRRTLGGLGEQFKKVSGAWVDNEWDTIRSRGYRATTRNQSAIEG